MSGELFSLFFSNYLYDSPPFNVQCKVFVRYIMRFFINFRDLYPLDNIGDLQVCF